MTGKVAVVGVSIVAVFVGAFSAVRYRQGLVDLRATVEQELRRVADRSDYLEDIANSELSRIAELNSNVERRVQLTERAIAEIRRLLASIAETIGEEVDLVAVWDEPPAASDGASLDEELVIGWTEELRERLDAASKALQDVTDPVIVQLYKKYSQGKNYKHWTIDTFLSDPLINPSGIVLTPEEKTIFALKWARAQSQMAAKKLQQEVFREQAMMREAAERIDRMESGLPLEEPREGLQEIVADIVRDGQSYILYADEYPQIGVLGAEIRPLIVEWLQEARGFLNPEE